MNRNRQRVDIFTVCITINQKTGQVRVGLAHELFRIIIYKTAKKKKHICCMGAPP